MEDVTVLKARSKKPATGKACLQLVIDLKNGLSKTPGLEHTIHAILACASESVNGSGHATNSNATCASNRGRR
jgi:hypothetical protein